MRIVVLVLALLIGCTDAKTVVDPDATALEVVVQVPAELGVDRLQLSAVGDEFIPGVVPDSPRPLAGEQSAVILLSPDLDGTELVVRVDGFAGETLVTSGGARAEIRAKTVRRVDVPLGEAAVCGDGKVADLIEPCDDGGTAATDGCSATCTVEPGFVCTTSPDGPSTCKPDTFDVVTARSVGHQALAIEFSAPPDPQHALDLASYNVPGLALSGTPFIDGNVVRIATSGQDPIDYDVVVTGVTRNVDGKPLTTRVGAFTGRTSFNLMSARSTSATQIELTFSDAVDPTTGAVLANYSVPNLTLTGTPVVAGAKVTIATSVQTMIEYTVVASNVVRAGDLEALAATSAPFSGVNGFDVTSAVATSNRQIMVTFNAPPNAAAANLANYTVSGLSLVGTPIVNGATVTIQTGPQTGATQYMLTVANVKRLGDNQVLTLDNALFTGVPLAAPTVTKVEVIGTNPDNGQTFFNTGTAQIRITGTQFFTVQCPAGVRLDDRDGAGGSVNTKVTACTVDTDTQITATLPAGIRTNGSTGWHVIVTNTIGSNANSDAVVVQAGLLISEVLYVGNAHEFVELYNPTTKPIDVGTLGVNMKMHILASSGGDTQKALSLSRTVIPSHGFFLIVSSNSDAGDPWFAHRDATYNAANKNLGANGGVYINLGNSAQSMVLDKVGWGTQPAGGFEGTPLPNLAPSTSVERKPAGGLGHATDSDVNVDDFNAATATPTPRGTVDSPQP